MTVWRGKGLTGWKKYFKKSAGREEKDKNELKSSKNGIVGKWRKM